MSFKLMGIAMRTNKVEIHDIIREILIFEKMDTFICDWMDAFWFIWMVISLALSFKAKKEI